MGEDRGPVARTDFKSDETRRTCLVGSTPTLVRHRAPMRLAEDGRRSHFAVNCIALFGVKPQRLCEISEVYRL